MMFFFWKFIIKTSKENDYSSCLPARERGVFIGSLTLKSGRVLGGRAHSSVEGGCYDISPQEFLTFILVYTQLPAVFLNFLLNVPTNVCSCMSSALGKQILAVTFWMWLAFQIVMSGYLPRKLSSLLSLRKVTFFSVYPAFSCSQDRNDDFQTCGNWNWKLFNFIFNLCILIQAYLILPYFALLCSQMLPFLFFFFLQIKGNTLHQQMI